jgi:hypothetical protein
MVLNISKKDQLAAEASLKHLASVEWAHQTIAGDGKVSLRIPLVRWFGRMIKWIDSFFGCSYIVDRIRNLFPRLFPQKSDIIAASEKLKCQVVMYAPEERKFMPQEKQDLLQKVAERFNTVVQKTHPNRNDLLIDLERIYGKENDQVIQAAPPAQAAESEKSPKKMARHAKKSAVRTERRSPRSHKKPSPRSLQEERSPTRRSPRIQEKLSPRSTRVRKSPEDRDLDYVPSTRRRSPRFKTQVATYFR